MKKKKESSIYLVPNTRGHSYELIQESINGEHIHHDELMKILRLIKGKCHWAFCWFSEKWAEDHERALTLTLGSWLGHQWSLSLKSPVLNLDHVKSPATWPLGPNCWEGDQLVRFSWDFPSSSIWSPVSWETNSKQTGWIHGYLPH